jgi:hypothetical protein
MHILDERQAPSPESQSSTAFPFFQPCHTLLATGDCSSEVMGSPKETTDPPVR